MAWQRRARGKVGATANLDSSCARRLCNTAGRDEETGLQVEQRNRARKIAALKPLDNKSPIKGASGSTCEAESTDAPIGHGPLRGNVEANAGRAREAGRRRWLGSTSRRCGASNRPSPPPLPRDKIG